MNILESIHPTLDTFVTRSMHAAGIPGLALALTDRTGLLGVATYGLANVAAQTPVQPEALFEIGSISKSFTAIALLQLHAAGRLELHAPVQSYLPWFDVPSSPAPITLHHLLTHTAGIPMGSDFTGEAMHEVWALRQVPAAAPPSERFRYSNVGYKALGLVLEALEKRPYPEIVRQRILEPLGMAASEPVITHDTRRRLAAGYGPWYDDRPFHPSHPLAPATWLETATADGSIASTAADMARYLRALLNRGAGLLTEESFALLTQPAVRPDDGLHGTFYGYGLTVMDQDGHTLIGHSGGMVGYMTDMVGDLHDGLGVIVLTNGCRDPGEIGRFALTLLRAAIHGEPLPPLPDPDPTLIADAIDYDGSFRAGNRAITLTAQDGRLLLQHPGMDIPLERREDDSFYVPHPDWELFLLHFGRRAGRVTEAFHGPDWYLRERHDGPKTIEHPAGWDHYPGHYRSHNPWYSNFRVVLRKGGLVLIEPDGTENPLFPLDERTFRVGDNSSPEWVRFSTVLDGRATCATLSGCDYYRTFTP